MQVATAERHNFRVLARSRRRVAVFFPPPPLLCSHSPDMISYYTLSKKKQLNQIVIAGTHDAGITGGGSGVQTQSLNIGEQAATGVRFFDVRVAAAVTS